ncbi:hypothetical protein TNCV_3267321 [Trichonephila clavipes]|nr:hypothetical protein TNCV_3267321 [Trichonephila clavipes]
MCWSSALRPNRNSSLRTTRLQSVTLELVRGRQKSNRYCLCYAVNDRRLNGTAPYTRGQSYPNGFPRNHRMSGSFTYLSVPECLKNKENFLVALTKDETAGKGSPVAKAS